MTARFNLLGLLVLALIGLILLIVFEPGLPPADHGTAETLSLHPPETVVIRVPGSDTMRLVRRDDVWLMQAPVTVEADRVQVAKLLRFLHTPVVAAYRDGVDIAAAGLATPKATLDVDGRAFRIGAKQPISQHRYVQSGDTVYLVRADPIEPIDAGIPGLISPRLLPRHGEPVEIRLPDYHLRRQARGVWHAVPPLAEAAVTGMVAAWRQASADHTESLAAGVSDWCDAWPVAVRLADRPQPITWQVMAQSGQVMFARPDIGLVYRFFDAAAAGLLAPIQDRAVAPDAARAPNQHAAIPYWD